MKIGNKKPRTMRYISSRQATGSGKKVKEKGLDFLEKDGKLQYFRRYPKIKKQKKSKNKKKKGNTNRRTYRNKRKKGGMSEDSASPTTTGRYSHTTDYKGMFEELIDKINELEGLFNGGWISWQEITDEIHQLGELIDRFSSEPTSVTQRIRISRPVTLKNRSRKKRRNTKQKRSKKRIRAAGASPQPTIRAPQYPIQYSHYIYRIMLHKLMDKIHRLRNVNSQEESLISSMIEELIDLADKYKRWEHVHRRELGLDVEDDPPEQILDGLDEALLMLES